MKSVEVKVIGTVTNERKEVIDDNWGEIVSTIHLSKEIFDQSSTTGLDLFSHIEVIFYMDRVKDEKIETGTRHPRNNKDWPSMGILAQRTKNRVNKIGLSRAQIISVDGLEIKVKGLDAVDQTPVIDIKPYMQEFAPNVADVKQPSWVSELMLKYY